MQKLASILFVGLVTGAIAVGGCKKKDGDTAGDGDRAPKQPAAAKKQPPPQATWTTADTLEQYRRCIAAYNGRDSAALAACYAAGGKLELLDLVTPMPMDLAGGDKVVAANKMYWTAFPDINAEPQLILASGNNLAAIVLENGTNSGEMMGRPATNQKVAALFGQLITLDASGKIVSDVHVGDQSTAAHQLGANKSPTAPDAEKAWDKKMVALATAADADRIATNVVLVENNFAAQESKDVATIMAHAADDIVFRYVPDKRVIEGKDAYKAGLDQYLGMSSAISREVVTAWGAGDWVVTRSVVKITLAADMPGAPGSAGKEVVANQIEFFRFIGGKVDRHWVFENSYSSAIQIGLAKAPEAKAPSP